MNSMNRIYTLLRTGAILPIIIFGCGCNIIDDNIVTQNVYFNPHENNNTPKDEQMYLFNVYPGDTNDFSGVCTLTVTHLTKGDTIVTHTIDSNYARITSYPDTICYRNDSLYGAPVIALRDTNSWTVFKRYIAAPDSFVLGAIVRDFLSAATVQELSDTTDTSMTCTAQQKEAVVAACDSMIHLSDFYHRYREKIRTSESIDDLLPLLNDLVAKAIFLDTTGLVASGLSLYQQTVLQWFNVTLLLTFVDKGIKLTNQDVTPVPFINPILKSHKVYRLLFQRGTSPHTFTQWAMRYIGINGDELIQIACCDEYGITCPEETKVADYTFSRGIPWQVTPLYFSRIPSIPGVNLHACITPSRAVVLQNKPLSSDSLSVLDYRLYYPFAGSISENGSSVHITGKTAITFSFIYDENNTESRTARITHWTSDTYIQKTVGVDNSTIYHHITRLVSNKWRAEY